MSPTVFMDSGFALRAPRNDSLGSHAPE